MSDTTVIRRQKQTMRKELRNARDAMAPADRSVQSLQIAARLRPILREGRMRFLHCYCSFGSEAATDAIIKESFDYGARVIVPVVRSKSDASLLHMEIDRDTRFYSGVFGTPTPEYVGADARKYCIPAELMCADDIIIVPLLAFDDRLYRLGYGKGHYDRFLSTTPGQKIGLAFDSQFVPQAPIESHDHPLDLIVTESRVYHREQA